MSLAKRSNPRVLDRRLQRWALPLLAVLAALAVVLVLRFMNKETKIVVGEDVYQFSREKRYDYQAGITLLQGKYDIVIDTEEEEVNGDATPLYSNAAPALYLARDVSWCDPTTGLEWFIPAFTRLEQDAVGRFRCEFRKENVQFDGGIINDCRGTYLFLDYTELQIGGRIVDLTPLSFCSVLRNTARIYDYESGQLSVMETGSENLIARVPRGYRVDLTRGIFTDAEGNSRLMVASPKVLQSIEDR